MEKNNLEFSIFIYFSVFFFCLFFLSFCLSLFLSFFGLLYSIKTCHTKKQHLMFPCPVCHLSFDKRNLVNHHLTEIHSDHPTPYQCSECDRSFSTEKALKFHGKKQHSENSVPMSSTISPTAKRVKLNPNPRMEMESILPATFLGDFDTWIKNRYNASKSCVNDHLSPSTVSRIQSFATVARFTVYNDDTSLSFEDLLKVEDDGIISDSIDNWMDMDIERFELQTVNNHIRYLKFLAMYRRDHIDPPHVASSVIDFLSDLVVDTQLSSARRTTTLNVLKLEDPFGLARIRDMVVNALLKEQVEYINPYIIRSLQSTDSSQSIASTGNTRLRNWLELALRFTNIPCRIQCTRELCLPSQEGYDYVSKLVIRDGQYCRLINQDKTASSHQPLLLPIGPNLSAYLFFYLHLARPKVDHNFVFVTKTGKQWIRPSRDLKQYLEEVLQVPIDKIDPTGRFIHGSRSIMMATVAIGVHFDQTKMYGFARLMRHSSTTNERFYSMWQQRHLCMQSIDTFAQVMGIDSSCTKILSPEMYEPVHLRRPPVLIANYFQRNLNQEVSNLNVLPIYSLRSIGTQTGADIAEDLEGVGSEDDTGFREINVADTVPPCRICGQASLVVFGPFGSRRRRRYFGRYYLGCPTCHKSKSSSEDNRLHLPSCLWYPLGYIPLQKSRSSRPRNMEEIDTYIQQHLPTSSRIVTTPKV
jgi:hypothetical protein